MTKYIIILTIGVIACTSGDNKSEITDILIQAEKNYNDDEWLAAIEDYSMLITLDTTNNIGEYYYRRAYCKALMDEIDESTLDYFKSIDQGYKNVESYLSIGLNYSILIKDSIAIIYYDSALQNLPDNRLERDLMIDTEEIIENARRESVERLQKDLHKI